MFYFFIISIRISFLCNLTTLFLFFIFLFWISFTVILLGDMTWKMIDLLFPVAYVYSTVFMYICLCHSKQCVCVCVCVFQFLCDVNNIFLVQYKTLSVVYWILQYKFWINKFLHHNHKEHIATDLFDTRIKSTCFTFSLIYVYYYFCWQVTKENTFISTSNIELGKWISVVTTNSFVNI